MIRLLFDTQWGVFMKETIGHGAGTHFLISSHQTRGGALMLRDRRRAADPGRSKDAFKVKRFRMQLI